MENKLRAMCRKFEGRVGLILASEDGSLDIRINENEVFSSASIIKLSILWAVFKAADGGRLSLSDALTVRSGDVAAGGVLDNLRAGLSLTIDDLCVLMMGFSDNTATNMLIDCLGFDRVNGEIAACGLRDTVLRRKMMDRAARERGDDNRTSPADAVKLLCMYHSPGGLEENSRARVNDILARQFYNNLLSHHMPEGFAFAHKTGNLPGVLHDAGILRAPDGKIYFAAVMCDKFRDAAAGVRFHNGIGDVIFEGLARGAAVS